MIPGINSSGYRANTVVPGSTAASVLNSATPTGYTDFGSNSQTHHALSYGNGEYVLAGVSSIFVLSSLTGTWTTVPIPTAHASVLNCLYAESGGTKYWLAIGYTSGTSNEFTVSRVAITKSLTEVTTAAQWTSSSTIPLGNVAYNISGSMWIPGHATHPYLFIAGNKSGQAIYTTSITSSTWTITSISGSVGTPSFAKIIPVQMSGTVGDRLVVGSTSSAISMWVSDSTMTITNAGSALGSGSPIGSNVPLDVIKYGNVWVVACQNSNVGMASTSGNFATAASWTATTISPSASYNVRSLGCRNGIVVAATNVNTSDKYICMKDISTGFSGGWTTNLMTTTNITRNAALIDYDKQFIPHVWYNNIGQLEYSW